MSVFDEIAAIIQEVKDLPAEAIRPESRIREDLDADSLDIVEMLMAIEEKYGIEIPEEAAEGIVTIADAVSFIEKTV